MSSLSISPCHDHEFTPTVQHTRRTTYNGYCIIPRLTVSPTQPVSHLVLSHIVLKSLHSNEYKLTDECSLSSRHATLPIYLLKVHHQCRSIIDSMCISKPTQLCPPSSHDHSLEVYPNTCSIMASQCVPNLAQSQPLSASPNSIWHPLQVCTISASKCIPKSAPFTSFTSISKLNKSQCGDTMELDVRKPIINTPPYHLRYAKGICKKVQFWLEAVIGYPAVRNHKYCIDQWSHCKSAWGTTQIVWIHESSAGVRGTKSWET